MSDWLLRLGSISEASMQQALWREAFTELETEALVDLVDRVLAGLHRKVEPQRRVYQALLLCFDDLPYEQKRALYEAAVELERDAVARLLLTPPDESLADPAKGEILSPQLTDDREVTMGERRAWARRPDRRSIDRLLFDSDPGVITNLLSNPRLTEVDVQRVASRRPNFGSSLRLVFAHPRWGHRPAVLRALAYNPHTPTGLAVGILPMVDLATLREIADLPGSSETLCRRAHELLLERQGLSVERDDGVSTTASSTLISLD